MMNETDLVANYDRAVELFSNEQYHQAERILLELLETNDDDFDVINFLGVIQQNSGNYIKAINYFNQVVFLYEGHAKAYYNLGYCYEKIGNAGLAAANFEKVISLDPQFIEAYLNLGQILITEEKFLTRYIIPKQLKRKFRSYLSSLGIDYRSIFPDLEGLAKTIVENGRTIGWGQPDPLDLEKYE